MAAHDITDAVDVKGRYAVATVDFHSTRIFAIDAAAESSPERIAAFDPKNFGHNVYHRDGNPDGTYVQQVPLVGLTSRPALSFQVGTTAMPLTPVNDFVGLSTRVTPKVEGKGTDVVFVGYGITAPEFNWDDYKGVDVKGKTLVNTIGTSSGARAANGLIASISTNASTQVSVPRLSQLCTVYELR